MSANHASVVWFESAGETWMDGLPVGNGRSGAMVYGGPYKHVLALNEETFWSPGVRERDLTAAAGVLSEVRALLANGDVLAAQSSAERLMGTPRLGAAFQPLADLVISTSGQNDYDYRRELDLASGVVESWWTTNGQRNSLRVIASRDPSVFVVVFDGEPRDSLLTLRSRFPVRVANPSRLAGDWAEVTANRNLVAGSYRLTRNEKERGLGFCVGLEVIQGEWEEAKGGLCVHGPNWMVAVAVSTSFEGRVSDKEVEQRLIDARHAGPISLVDDSIATHAEVFNRASIELALSATDLAVSSLPTDERVHAVRAGGLDDGLMMLFANFGRYLMIASTVGGFYPPTLQGVWNEDTEPAWSSNWTLNINTQMNLWSADVFHVTEASDCLANLTEGLARAGERTAQLVYGAQGWVVHHNTDIWLNTAPTTMVEVGLFPAAGLWLVQQLWQHHLHYPERSFDKRVAPLLTGAVEFVSSWLVVDSDGYLSPSPSSAPENAYLLGSTPRPRSRAVDPDYSVHGWIGWAPSLDMWLIRDTLRIAIELGPQMGASAEQLSIWADTLEQLRPVAIADGEIPEWTWSYRALELGHRHLSPLYFIYPGKDDAHDTTAITRAARNTLINRLAKTQSWSNGWGGWSRVWAAAAWARLGEGDWALASLESVLRTGVAPDSLLHAFPEFEGHPGPDAVHQIDANMGAPAAVAELMIQSSPGVIRLLPALPARWKAGRARNLRAVGGIDVTFEWANGELVRASLVANRNQEVRVVAPNLDVTIVLETGRPHELVLADHPSSP